jgi:hypothetical protein
MTSRDFCYWLQGFYELSTANAPTSALTPEQSSMVKRHLALVFKHEIDPSIDNGKPELAQAMQAIHDGKLSPPKIGGHGPGDTLYRC